MKVKQLKKEIDAEIKDVLKERKELKQKRLEDNSIWSKLYNEMWRRGEIQ